MQCLQAKDGLDGISNEHGPRPPAWKAAFDMSETVGKVGDLRVGIKTVANSQRANSVWSAIRREMAAQRESWALWGALSPLWSANQNNSSTGSALAGDSEKYSSPVVRVGSREQVSTKLLCKEDMSML